MISISGDGDLETRLDLGCDSWYEHLDTIHKLDHYLFKHYLSNILVFFSEIT